MQQELFELDTKGKTVIVRKMVRKFSNESIGSDKKEKSESPSLNIKLRMMEELKILGLSHDAIERILNLKQGRI